MPKPYGCPPPEIQEIRPPETAQLRPFPPSFFAVRDPEKAGFRTMPSHSRQGSGGFQPSLHSPTHIAVGDEIQPAPEPYESHLGTILFHLSATSALVSIGVAFYAIVVLLILLVLTPLSLFTTQPAFSHSVSSYLSPAMRTQLRLIYSDAVRSRRHRSDTAPLATLVVCALLGPFYASVVMVSAWTAGVFWGFAAIVGEPNQKGGKQEIGRAAVGAVRRWWETFLLWGLGRLEERYDYG